MKTLLAALTGILAVIFIVGNVQAEWRNRKALPWYKNALSDYLSGVPGALLQDVSYVAFAAGLVLFGLWLGALGNIMFGAVGAAALCFVVATAVIDSVLAGKSAALVRKIHLASAGVAFGCTTVMLLLFGIREQNQIVFALAVAAPISAVLFLMFEPEETTLEEKSYTAFLLAALFVTLLPTLEVAINTFLKWL